MIKVVKNGKGRNSSVELLRVVSMIFIIIHHFLSRNYGLCD